MDALKLSLGVKELKEALSCISEAQRHFRDGLGTDDILKYMIETTNQDSWTGKEIESLVEAEKLIRSVQIAYGATKVSSFNTWKDRMPPGLWSHVEPIAEHVDITKMVEYFFSNNDEILTADPENLSYEIESFMSEALLSYLGTCGFNLSIEDIITNCDLGSYIEYINKVKQKEPLRINTGKEAWAYHLLTNFFDVVLLVDAYNWEDYNTRVVCERILGSKI